VSVIGWGVAALAGIFYMRLSQHCERLLTVIRLHILRHADERGLMTCDDSAATYG
jgi:hypothetical protein